MGTHNICFHGEIRNISIYFLLNLLLLNTTYPVLANSIDPDHFASEEANWSGSALFNINYVNFYQKTGSSNNDWLEIRSGRGILIYSAWQGLKNVISGAVASA